MFYILLDSPCIQRLFTSVLLLTSLVLHYIVLNIRRFSPRLMVLRSLLLPRHIHYFAHVVVNEVFVVALIVDGTCQGISECG
jgi:hypothetical protein